MLRAEWLTLYVMCKAWWLSWQGSYAMIARKKSCHDSQEEVLQLGATFAPPSQLAAHLILKGASMHTKLSDSM